MIEEFISGIIYTEFDDVLGPTPKLWLPADLSENIRMLISIKTITLLSGEENALPKELIIIPFSSLSMKGLIKYVQWDDESRRGGIARTAFTVLFKEQDDVIFYKYITNFEDIFQETANKIKELELSKAENELIMNEVENLKIKMTNLLEELRDNEISTKEADAFPEAEASSEDQLLYRFKTIIAGDPGCGKTSTTLRFTDNAFKRTYMPTIGVNISEKNLTVDNANVQLIIWDVAGQSKFDTMRGHFYQGAEGVFLVFDLTREKTFQSIKNWHADIKKAIKTKYGFVGFLLANKNDLVNERKVSREDAEKLAKELGLKYFETSALTGENVNEAFHTITKTLLDVKSVMKMKRF